MLVKDFLAQQQKAGAHFCDFFAERVQSLTAEITETHPGIYRQGNYHGIGIRIFKSDGEGYYHTSDLTPAGVYRLAKRIVRSDDPKGTLSGAEHTPVSEETLDFWDNGLSGIPIPEQILGKAAQGAFDAGRVLRYFHCRVWIFIQDVKIITSEGFDVSERRKYLHCQVEASLEKKGDRCSARLNRGACGSQSFNPETAEEMGRKVVDLAEEKSDAISLPGGELPVILGPGSGALLFHEACGHPLEADYIQKRRSVFADLLGTRVASQLVTIVDDPLQADGGVYLRYDDEGVNTRKRILIEKGYLRKFLSDRKNARMVSGAASGNGRRQSYREPPLPRMSNLLLMPGQTPPEEIIKETEHGIYAQELGGGKIDPPGGRFIFKITRGYEVRDGKIGRPLKVMLLRGSVRNFLRNIDRVGNDFRWAPGPSFCDKEGQRIPVGLGQPTIRVSSMTVGNR